MPLAPYVAETAEVPNKNVIASMTPPPLVRGVIIVANSGDIVPGTVLGKITATGKYKVYNNGNGDGSETARCIALNFAPVNATRDQQIHAAFGGILVLDALVGLDGPAVTDFAGVQDSNINVFKF